MNKTNNVWVLILIVGLLGVGAGFVGGMKYQQSKLQSFGRGFVMGGGGSRNGVGGMMGNQNRFRPVVGEISAMDDSSITVKMTDGSSKIVLLGTSAVIEKSEVGGKQDLVVGKTVRVLGSENNDGSISASNIQINPNIRNITGAPTKL